ncbi:PRC-barrel domain-containing protein [Methylocapsa sp. D3K7]|uniref:PRC-barrel domain-containing protein n=1 Tax=Methylocapsa sp. D3K7 TaxID=3041435 RepID=UPI00244E81FC|nr:PRC-barrel domain-containing protein [Methylocapsa sp. D3K7]WGJ13844.1 PRC-barrel domain-containing protein [Methylocapsa sp. D3K7]
MLKRLCLSASVLVLASGVAVAQTSMRPAPSPTGPAATYPSVSTMRLLASDIYKANVYDESENKIGDVTDLAMNGSGNIRAAIIGVGGFLGVGQKDVSIPFKDLKISSRGGKDWLTLNRTKEALRSMPAYEPMGRSAATSSSSLSTGNWLASDIYKADVYDNAENKLGAITDLVLNNNGDITTAVIGVGGVLGAGQKDVAVPFKELKVTSRDGKDWLVLDRTKDDLKSAPAWDKKSETRM